MRASVIRALTMTAAVLASSGCGDEPVAAPTRPDEPPPAAGCPPGTLELDDKSCLPAGAHEEGCAPGEAPRAGGGCDPAGVVDCGRGFEPDGRGGCEPVLPPGVCAPGLLAVPGDIACREVAPCGVGPWGELPPDAGETTQYVDAEYTGADSDGSADRPWLTVQAAVDAAAPRAIVAIAAGSYVEDVVIEGKPVQLVGRCPALVEIVGSASSAAAIRIGDGAASTEVRALAITGASQGVYVERAEDVVIDRVWIHDTEYRGLYVEGGPAPAGVQLSGSLVEATRRLGVWLRAASGTIDASVVRGTLASADGQYGDGIFLEDDGPSERRASLTLTRSVVEKNRKVGVFVGGSDLVVDATVVSGTVPADGIGRGIQAQDNPATGARADLAMTRTVVSGMTGIGVFVAGSDAAIESSVVRGTLPSPGIASVGLAITGAPGGRAPAVASVRASLFEDNSDVNVFVEGSRADFEATRLGDVVPAFEGSAPVAMTVAADAAGVRADVSVRFSAVEGTRGAAMYIRGSDFRAVASVVRDTRSEVGAGSAIDLEIDPATGAPTIASIRSCVVEDNQPGNLLVNGSDVEIEATIVRAGRPLASGSFGRGVSVQRPYGGAYDTRAVLRGSIVEDNVEAAVFVAGARLEMSGTIVRRTQPTADGAAGAGVLVQPVGSAAPSAATLTHCLIEDNHEAGVLVFDSSIEVVDTEIRRTLSSAVGLGDGIAAVSELRQATASVRGSVVDSSTRAGVSSFGSKITLAETRLECNAIDLDGEPYLGRGFDFENVGGNVCGCAGTSESCSVQSANLTPPEPLAP